MSDKDKSKEQMDELFGDERISPDSSGELPHQKASRLLSLFEQASLSKGASLRTPSPNLLTSLIQTQAWFNALASRTGDILAILEPIPHQSFRITYVSEQLYNVLGYTPDTLRQLRDDHFLHPDDLHYVRSALKRCAETPEGREVLEFRAIHQDGHWLHLESYMINCIHDLSIGGLLISTRDVTQSRERENQLLSRVSWFAALLNQVTDAIRVIGADGSIQVASGRLNWLFGDSGHGLNQQALLQRIHPEDQTRVREGMAHALQVPGERIRLGFRARNTAEEEWHYIELELFNRLNDSMLEGVIITCRDLSSRKLFDSATRLPSRTLFLDRVERLLNGRNRIGSQEFAVLVIDVDRFSEVNGGLGNAAGERLLKTIGSRLVVSVPPSDNVGRLGRDKFTVLLHGMRAPADIARICQRIHKSIEQPCFLGGHKVFTTVTIGVAFSTSDFTRADEMLQAAETAMNRGKQTGGSTTEMFDPAMGEEVRGRLRLEGSLRHAIERQEFVLHYQPIVELSTRCLIGFEALCRWEHPDSGFVSPAEFIPVAEDTGMIHTIGEWVLSRACECATEWQSKHGIAPLVSVNLSGKQLVKPGLVEEVKAILQRTQLDPARLKLEVTETALISNTEDVAQTLRALRGLGLNLALDDFGTGYSSLNYLHRLPFNTIKIDKSFVKLLTEDEENTAIVPTIIQLAKSLHMDVIAEGVETIEQVNQLIALGCPYAQGFFFSRAIPEKRLHTVLSVDTMDTFKGL